MSSSHDWACTSGGDANQKGGKNAKVRGGEKEETGQPGDSFFGFISGKTRPLNEKNRQRGGGWESRGVKQRDRK